MVYGLPIENEDGLKASEIMNKLRAIVKIDGEIGEGLLSLEFLEILIDHPRSICQRNMTDTLKLIIAIKYLEYKKLNEEYPEYKQGFTGSYEDLAKILDRSKASIWQAIHEKGEEAKRILADKDQSISINDLDKDQKEKLLARLLEEKSKENGQTNE